MMQITKFSFFTFQINEFVKRARAAKIHAYIMSHLKKEMPAMMGKAKTQQRLIDNLEDEFGKVPKLSIYFSIGSTIKRYLYVSPLCHLVKKYPYTWKSYNITLDFSQKFHF